MEGMGEEKHGNNTLKKCCSTFSVHRDLDAIPDSTFTSASLLGELESTSTNSLGGTATETLVTVQRSEAKSVRKIIDTMLKNPYDEQLQASSCAQLVNWSKDDYYRIVITSLGGISCVLDAMRNFTKSRRIQINGCHVIGNLCAGDNMVTKQKISSLGGVMVITTAMKSHPSSNIVNGVARYALKNLTLTTREYTHQTKANLVRDMFNNSIR